MTKIVEYAIHELLDGLAGGRVYALIAPQNVTAPFIIFQRVGGQRMRSVSALQGIAEVEIQVDCYANEFYEMKALASSIENILDGYAGTVYYGSSSPQSSVRITSCSLQSENDIQDQTEEPFLFRNTARYFVTFETD